jgi:hypothetical protein
MDSILWVFDLSTTSSFDILTHLRRCLLCTISWEYDFAIDVEVNKYVNLI